MKYVLAACSGLVLFLIGSSILTEISQINIAEWLIGTWENQTPRGTIYEEWSRTSESEFSAVSFAIADEDTIIFETIRLAEDEDGLLYIPAVRNQNEGQPVVFKSEKLSPDKMIFSNPDHDFPQFISYTRISPDSLVAEIYGTINDQERRMEFRMRKIR